MLCPPLKLAGVARDYLAAWPLSGEYWELVYNTCLKNVKAKGLRWEKRERERENMGTALEAMSTCTNNYRAVMFPGGINV